MNLIKKWGKENYKFIFFCIISAILSYLHFDIIKSYAYVGDDWCNAYIEGACLYTGMPVRKLVWEAILSWVKKGRFFPVVYYLTYYSFYFFRTVTAYRNYMIIVTIIMITLMAVVMKKLTNDQFNSAAFLFITPVLFWMSYSESNALICYNGMVQFTLILTSLSILALLRWREDKKIIYALLAAGLYLGALLTYEVSYIYVFFIAIAFYYKDSDIKKVIRCILPVIISFVLSLFMYVVVRMHAGGSEYIGTQIAMNPFSMLRTIVCMMMSAFPMYTLLSSEYAIIGLEDVSLKNVVVSFFMAVCFVLSYYFFKGKQTVRQKGIIYIMGFVLWVFPAILISVSDRYQNVIKWGINWLPYVAEVIGVALIVVQLIKSVYDAFNNRFFRQVWSICLFAVLFVCILWNRVYAEKTYPLDPINRTHLIECAIKDGIFEDVQENDIIYADVTVHSERWPYYVYSQHAGKRINADVLQNVLQFRDNSYDHEYTAKCIIDDSAEMFVLGSTNFDNLKAVNDPKIYIDAVENIEKDKIIFSTTDREDIEISLKEIAISDHGLGGGIFQLNESGVLYDSLQYLVVP